MVNSFMAPTVYRMPLRYLLANVLIGSDQPQLGGVGIERIGSIPWRVMRAEATVCKPSIGRTSRFTAQ
ncbi:hypothetical protein BN873_350144 [Candidatus Competibacter denitrificans Run_A_D11]|uniref:Uncharacterized protein n=1 Tax=Candidatus Competibacter denitrificans Run_A_D11 TaxID=1400863 RepID=W6MDH8_9GAMM|nr:hypothetical protein BN873_350144 [Candidatus Competibacter denitrificans Run_A_D11]